jgi:hypothetical protein
MERAKKTPVQFKNIPKETTSNPKKLNTEIKKTTTNTNPKITNKTNKPITKNKESIPFANQFVNNGINLETDLKKSTKVMKEIINEYGNLDK